MKKIEFKTRMQWDYFRSAFIGVVIGMLIAPGVSDLVKKYDNVDGAGRKSIADICTDAVDYCTELVAPGERTKVVINNKVVAIAKNEAEANECYKKARLAYNADGIKPLWLDVSFSKLDKENDADKALAKEMKALKGQELADTITKSFDAFSDGNKKLAYTMRIDDYVVTVERFEDIVSVLEKAQSVYDTNDEFRVGLKQPESKNVSMYEVEISEKLDDVERNVPDKIENKEQTIDGATEDETSQSNNKNIIPDNERRALTAGEIESGEAESSEKTLEDNESAEESSDEASKDNESDEESSEEETTEVVVNENDPAVVEAEAKLGQEDGIKYVGFSDRIYVGETYVAPSKIKDKDTVYADVTTPVDEAGVYVVVPGDCLSIIAQKVGMSEDKIKELNDGIENDDDIYYDDRLNIVVPTPPVEIMVEKQETYTEKYYADVEYQDDGSMYIGETSVIRDGEPGIHTVTDLVTYKGETESGRKHVDEVVEVAAVSEVVLRGTKSKPTYMFPVTNWDVTSNFGYRWGRLHAGVDVGVPQGTTVRASRGGQVITAGWVGGYGNCVIIDHGDGVSTRYGHLSEVLVSVGQYVDQGDQIALSGNTGRSTGPHLHFEIRINGEAVDPLPYLYQ